MNMFEKKRALMVLMTEISGGRKVASNLWKK